MVEAKTVEGQEIGQVTEYFAKIGVAGIDLTGSLNVGDRICLQGHTTDFEQVVDSLQIEHASVEAAKAGDKIGVKVKDRCRRGDRVYRLPAVAPP
ncbi:MAG: translation elongation factor-like protein [Chloroflexi bacterium]|nr:translation elongation factor-like protein [Chloroflexota bacterium]